MTSGTGLSGSAQGRDPLLRKAARAAVSAGVSMGAAGLLALHSPVPAARLIRRVFTKGAEATVREMRPYVPDAPRSEQLDVAFAPDRPAATLDVFGPGAASSRERDSAHDGAPRPAVVWVHGGAWISGGKEDVAPYLRILASHGYIAVGLGYPIAPETGYPGAVRTLNAALAYLVEHAAELGIDPQRIVLAGDSAGAQLASQLAVLTVNPDYARLLGIDPALRREQLVGAILHCGVYDLRAMADLTGLENWGFKVALWAYTGTKDWSSTYAGLTMSTCEFVTPEFPPTLISGGNGDALTWLQSVPMRNRLIRAGVDTTALFWPADHEPALPHEYQFHLDLEDAQAALTATLDWLAVRTAPRTPGPAHGPAPTAHGSAPAGGGHAPSSGPA